MCSWENLRFRESRGPAGQSVDVRLTYDLNGVLEVEATIVETGKKVNKIITRNAKGLNSAQIQEAIRAMEKLKSHPREETAQWLAVAACGTSL